MWWMGFACTAWELAGEIFRLSRRRREYPSEFYIRIITTCWPCFWRWYYLLSEKLTLTSSWLTAVSFNSMLLTMFSMLILHIIRKADSDIIMPWLTAVLFNSMLLRYVNYNGQLYLIKKFTLNEIIIKVKT